MTVPRGIFYTSTLYLRDGVTLWLADGAVLKAVPDGAVYDCNGFFDSFGAETNSFLMARGVRDVTIDGRGTIDLSGEAFFDFAISSADAVRYGADAWDIPAIPGERIRRPILFDDCQRVRIANVRLTSSPCWTVTCNRCRDIKITSVTIENHLRAPHSDGVHLCGCEGAIISQCHFTCGDDCIALTCLLDDTQICRDIVVSDCVLCSRSAAVRIGHKSGRVENVRISNLVIHDTNRAFAIFAGRGGYVRRVSIAGVVLDTHIYAGGWWGKGEPFVLATESGADGGEIEDIHLTDVLGTAENVGVIVGHVTRVRMRDVAITLRDTPKRRYVQTYDIAPNGEIGKRNGFEGMYYTDCAGEILVL